MKRKTKPMKKQYSLMDAEKQNELHPESFEIPDREDRLNVKPDTFAKLCFQQVTKVKKGSPCGERMWVKVLSTTPIGGLYEGILSNNPMFVSGIKFGSRVSFSAKHILDIQTPSDE